MRWRILALVFFATTINYLDRIVFSVLIPVIRAEMHIDDTHYGYITGAFTILYTFGFLVAGKLVDHYGSRIGYALAIVWWSLAAALHAVAHTGFDLGFWRGMLGFGEAGNFPAAIKSVAEWFPKKDRALATGIFNSGTTVASIVGPPVFVWLNALYGWRACFVITGAIGFLWVVLWLLLYRAPPPTSASELKEPKVGWAEAFKYPQTWGFALAKGLTDPVWWFYLYWLPPYLYDVRKFNLSEIGWAIPVVYVTAGVGSIGGGWVSRLLMNRGMPSGRALMTAMAMFAAVMPFTAMGVLAPNPVVTILLIAVACAAHQAWSANLFTTTSDVFPKNVVGTVTSIGGCAGGLGGFIFSAILPGFIVTHFGYGPMFAIMGSLHVIAFIAAKFLLWGRPPVVMENA